MNFGKPLLSNVFERCWRCDGEADEEHISLWVRKRAESVVIFLTGSIEETESVGFIADHDGDCIVVEDGGDVFGGKFVGGVGYEEACLSHCTVAHNDTLDSSHNHIVNGGRMSCEECLQRVSS